MASEVHDTDGAVPETSVSADREPMLTLKLLSPSAEIPSPLILTDVPAALTVGELRLRIRDSVPSHPAPERQRLIHLGRMLGDQTEQLVRVFGLPVVGYSHGSSAENADRVYQLESSSTQVLHLVMSPLPARSPNMVRASSHPERDIRVPSERPSSVSARAMLNPQQAPPMAPHIRPDATHFPLMVQPEQLPPFLHPSMAELIQQPIPPGTHPHHVALHAPHIAGQRRIPSHSHNIVTSGGAVPAPRTRDDYEFQRNVAHQQRARVSAIRYGTGTLPGEGHRPLAAGTGSATSSAGREQTNSGSGRNHPDFQPPLTGSQSVHPDNIDPRLHTWQITVTEGAVAIPTLPNGQGVGGSLTGGLPGFAGADTSPLPPDLPLPPPIQPQEPSPLLSFRFGGEEHPATAAPAAARDAFEVELGLVPGQPYPAQYASPWARQAVRPSEPSHRRERGPIPSTTAAAATRPRRVRQRPNAVYSTAPPRPSAFRRTGPSSQTREHLSAAYRQPEDTTLYLLLSPEGPRGLLIAPSGQYRADLANAVYMPHMGVDSTHRHPNPGANPFLLPFDMPVEERYRPGTSRVRLSARTGRPGATEPTNAMLPQQSQPQRPAQAPAQVQVQQPAQQQRPQEDNAGRMHEILRIVLPVGGHLWLFIRLLGFVYFFTGGSGWRRSIVVILSALVIFAAQAGFLDGVRDAVWGPVRRHLEAVLPLADARPAVNRRAGAHGIGQAVPNNNDNNNNNNNADAVNNPHNGPAAAPPRVDQDPDPAAIAARLIRQQQQQQQQQQQAEALQGRGWLTERLRSFERSVLIFLASLVPGVGERHIAARDAAEAAAEAAAAATAPTEHNQNPNGHQGGATSTSAAEQQHPESSQTTAIALPSTHGITTDPAPQASSQTAADPSRHGGSSTSINSDRLAGRFSYSDVDAPSSTSESDPTRSTGSVLTTAAAAEAPNGVQGGSRVHGEVADDTLRRRMVPQQGGHVEQGSGARQDRRGEEGGEEHGYGAGQE